MSTSKLLRYLEAKKSETFGESMVDLSVLNYHDRAPINPRKNLGPLLRCQSRERFCGPAAVSMMTGLTTGQVALEIFQLRDARKNLTTQVPDKSDEWRRSVNGFSAKEMIGIVTHLGLKSITHYMNDLTYWRRFRDLTSAKDHPARFLKTVRKSCSLHQFVTEFSSQQGHRTFAVTLSNHWVVVQGEMVGDNVHGLLPWSIFPAYARSKIRLAIEVFYDEAR